MDRDESFIKILEATAKIQSHVAVILEAKANEAEKSRNWFCRHVLDSSFEDDSAQLKESNEFHDRIIEAIDGITKVETGLASNMKVLLNQGEEASNPDDYGDLFNMDDED